MADAASTSSRPYPSEYDALEETPPSSKLVLKVLEYEGELTQAEIVDETRLSGRTVRYGLDVLEEMEAIEKRPSLRDARQDLYRVAGADPEY